ncbi:hypothetical protein T03_212 [Trichinella britovi]|uniref:Uncharacterized protein n=1 Tax=Trichinella britovi TaxID=45882 RepID=A0A0V1AW13_TRIBR|nr:hypothetical protein T03_212 [Trichinella britovi]
MCGQRLAYGQLKVYVSCCKGDFRKTRLLWLSCLIGNAFCISS